MRQLSQECINAGIPVYVGADSMVKDGGFATVGIDYISLGRQTADMAVRILNGETIRENPIEVVNQYSNMINMKTLKDLGLEIEEEKSNGFQLIK